MKVDVEELRAMLTAYIDSDDQKATLVGRSYDMKSGSSIEKERAEFVEWYVSFFGKILNHHLGTSRPACAVMGCKDPAAMELLPSDDPEWLPFCDEHGTTILTNEEAARRSGLGPGMKSRTFD